MRALVSLKRAVLREPFRTILTPKWPLSTVFVHVCLEITILRERLGTKLALIRFDFIVDKLVSLEMTKTDKRS